jgi:hypothetical protein
MDCVRDRIKPYSPPRQQGLATPPLLARRAMGDSFLPEEDQLSRHRSQGDMQLLTIHLHPRMMGIAVERLRGPLHR